MGFCREHQTGAFSTEVILLEEKAFSKHSEILQLPRVAFSKHTEIFHLHKQLLKKSQRKGACRS